jgi:hypothetical protein
MLNLMMVQFVEEYAFILWCNLHSVFDVKPGPANCELARRVSLLAKESINWGTVTAGTSKWRAIETLVSN